MLSNEVSDFIKLMYNNIFLVLNIKITYFIEFQISSNQTLGRHIIATRNIKAGEIILRECPLVVGPKIASHPVCLGCHKQLTLDNSNKDFYKCTKCRWPVCNILCETSKFHFEECQLISQTNQPCPIKTNQPSSAYCVITPLRCLFLQKNNNNG